MNPRQKGTLMKKEETYTVIGTKGEKEYILAENQSFEEAIMVIEKKNDFYDNLNISEEYMLEDKPLNFVVVSDAKMMLSETKILLERPISFKEQFIFLGNFIDEGPGFYEFMSYLVQLNKRRDCIFVKGKNEYNLMEYINQTERYLSPVKEVASMIESIEKELHFPVYAMKTKFPDFYDILSNTIDFYENDNYIFTSGGVDLELDRWKQSQPEELFETTETFIIEKNLTNKTVVFGGLPVSFLNRSLIIKPWFNATRDKIGINGNCKAGGKLLGLFIHDNIQSFMGVRNIEEKKANSKRRKQLAI